jgi:hypothetical protein
MFIDNLDKYRYLVTNFLPIFIFQMLKQHQDEEMVVGLAQLKYAFDNVERVQPGLTQTFVLSMVEQLQSKS